MKLRCTFTNNGYSWEAEYNEMFDVIALTESYYIVIDENGKTRKLTRGSGLYELIYEVKNEKIPCYYDHVFKNI